MGLHWQNGCHITLFFYACFSNKKQLKSTPWHSRFCGGFSTVAQLRELTRREFIDTSRHTRFIALGFLECLFLTSDAFALLLFLSLLKQGEYMAVFTPWGIRITVAV